VTTNKTILAGITACLITLLIVVEANMLFPDGSMEEISIDERELEENIRENSEYEWSLFHLLSFGGDTIITERASQNCLLAYQIQLNKSLNISSKKCSKLSLTILYCTLKIALS